MVSAHSGAPYDMSEMQIALLGSAAPLEARRGRGPSRRARVIPGIESIGVSPDPSGIVRRAMVG